MCHFGKNSEILREAPQEMLLWFRMSPLILYEVLYLYISETSEGPQDSQ